MTMLTDAMLAPLALPPERVPSIAPIAPIAPLTLRPLTLEENAAAFSVCEAAFAPAGTLTPEHDTRRQANWEAWGRAWFGWLQQQAGDRAVAAVTAEGALAGYARALRDDTQRVEHLTDLYVRAEFQQAHAGRALLEAVLARQVAPGWRRFIVANPDARALALYHRWGTLPLATLWGVGVGPMPALAALARARLVGESERGVTIRTASLERDLAAINRLDRMALGFTRAAQHRFAIGHQGAQALVLKRAGEVMGYGLRAGGLIGPVVGKTAADAVTLVAAHVAELAGAGGAIEQLWAPGANVALWRWLAAPELRLVVRGQATLMASEPALAATLDRVVLTAPPYVV